MGPYSRLPMAQVAVIGAGSFGSVIARILGNSCMASPLFQDSVRLYARRQEMVEEINQNHTNSQYLADCRFPTNITASADLTAVVKDAKFIVLGVPSAYL